MCDANATGQRLEFEAVFARKEANHCGLQLADLVARPLGRHIMNPGQSNRAYEQIEKKFRRSPDGSVHGWGHWRESRGYGRWNSFTENVPNGAK